MFIDKSNLLFYNTKFVITYNVFIIVKVCMMYITKLRQFSDHNIQNLLKIIKYVSLIFKRNLN